MELEKAVFPLVVALLWVAPMFALAWITGLARSWFHRSHRRNPITRDLLRSPGHTLREQLDDVRMDMMAWVSVGSSVPLFAAVLYFAGRYFQAASSQGWLTYALIGIGGFSFAAYKLVSLVARAKNLRLGLEAETAVGEELNLLMKDGFSVVHDLPGDKLFNIDHVVVGPQGVFSVETKGRAKPVSDGGHKLVLRDGRLHFPEWTESEPLEQARRNAAWVAKWLSSAVGEPVDVKPVLVIPGWWIELQGPSDVAVLSGKNCRPYFTKARRAPLSAKLVQQISHQLEARCRDVATTTYKPLKD